MSTTIREAVVTYKRSQRRVEARKIASSSDVAPVAREVLPDQPTEVFLVLGLDTKHRVTSWHEAGRGGMTACPVDPASVFRWAVIVGVSRVILVHNHPSGDPAPSPEDLLVTRKLVQAGEVLGIQVLDHLILGEGSEYCSFRDAGLMESSS